MQNYQCRGIEFNSSLQTGNELRNEVWNMTVKSDLKLTITQNICTTFVQRNTSDTSLLSYQNLIIDQTRQKMCNKNAKEIKVHFIHQLLVLNINIKIYSI